MFIRVAIIAIIFLAISKAKRVLHFEITKASCDCFVPRIAPSWSCQLIKIGNVTRGFGHIYVAQEIKKFEVRAVAKVIQKKKNRSLQMLDVRLNACDFLNAAHKSVLFKNMMCLIKKYVPVVPYCPIKAHTNITGGNFAVESNELIPYAPEGTYDVKFDVYFRKKFSGYLYAEFSITAEEV